MNTTLIVRSVTAIIGILAILLPALKVSNEVDWSWWLVLAPIWVPITAICGIIIFLSIAFSGVEDCPGDYE